LASFLQIRHNYGRIVGACWEELDVLDTLLHQNGILDFTGSTAGS
jgi:hypothetical protein